jgi:hypothetical protein
MKTAEITLNGVTHTVAPLKCSQVAAFLDNKTTSTVQLFTKSLRTIAWALQRAGDPIVAGLDEEAAIAKLNEFITDWREVDIAFGVVTELTGMKAAADAAPGSDPGQVDQPTPIAA